MPITNSSAQKSKTLEQFYAEIAQEEEFLPKLTGKRMLELLEMINRTFPETPLWGLTSHYRLVVQAADDWKSPWYVIISIAGDEYQLEYLMPEDQRPWRGARVIGGATTPAELRRKLIIAMHACEGWANNEELADLLRQLNEE